MNKIFRMPKAIPRGYVKSAVVLLLFAIPTLVAATDGEEVLVHLKAHDSLFESGLTLSGNQNIVNPMQGVRYKYRWTITTEGERTGFLLEMADFEFMNTEGRNENRHPPARDGLMRRTLRIKHWGYWGPDVSGFHYEERNMKFLDNGDRIETGTSHASSLFEPFSRRNTRIKDAILWSTGHLFSPYIDRILSVEELEGGLLRASAAGWWATVTGQWEIVIEPERAWMVREAQFRANASPELLLCEMRTSGTKWDGPYLLPNDATLSFLGPIDGPRSETIRITFGSALMEFDTDLYSAAHQAVVDNRPSKSTTMDNRRSPPTIHSPDDLARSATRDVVQYLSGELGNVVLEEAEDTLERNAPLVVEKAMSAPEKAWYLLPISWAFPVIIVALLITGASCALLMRSR